MHRARLDAVPGAEEDQPVPGGVAEGAAQEGVVLAADQRQLALARLEDDPLEAEVPGAGVEPEERLAEQRDHRRFSATARRAVAGRAEVDCASLAVEPVLAWLVHLLEQVLHPPDRLPIEGRRGALEQHGVPGDALDADHQIPVGVDVEVSPGPVGRALAGRSRPAAPAAGEGEDARQPGSRPADPRERAAPWPGAQRHGPVAEKQLRDGAPASGEAVTAAAESLHQGAEDPRRRLDPFPVRVAAWHRGPAGDALSATQAHLLTGVSAPDHRPAGGARVIAAEGERTPTPVRAAAEGDPDPTDGRLACAAEGAHGRLRPLQGAKRVGPGARTAVVSVERHEKLHRGGRRREGRSRRGWGRPGSAGCHEEQRQRGHRQCARGRRNDAARGAARRHRRVESVHARRCSRRWA